MSEASTQALQVVARELNNELNDARTTLELFAEQQSQIELLAKCRDHLHQVRGALRMVEVYGAVLLAEEMEHLLQHLIDVPEQQRRLGEAMDALLRAMAQLPTYFERVISGGQDMALILLPLLNDLRAVRGQSLLSEGTLLLLNLNSDRQANPVVSNGADSEMSVQDVARKMRIRFQLGLLGLIKSERIEQNLEIMADAAATLEQVATSQPVFQLWWVVGAIIEALQTQGLENNASVKRLLGQADREMKRLYEQGEKQFCQSPPIDLLNNLLYYVARASSSGERISAVRASFHLDELLPLDHQVEQARASLSAPSVKLMKTVADAIAEDLTRVKDALDLFVREGATQIQELIPQLELLKKIGDTLGVLGLEELRETVRQQTRALQSRLEKNIPPDESSLLAVASALISIEDRLGDQLIALIQPNNLGKQQLGAQQENHLVQSGEFRQVSGAVLRECVVNLARIKEVIALAVEKKGDAQLLDQLPQLIQGVTAGLLMLGRGGAVKVVEQIELALKIYCRPAMLVQSLEKISHLAEAIVALEYHLEGLQAGRADSEKMLDTASKALQALDLGSPASAEKLPSVVRELAKPGQVSFMQSKVAPAAVSHSQVTEQSPVAKAQFNLPPVLVLPPDKTDPEFLELFIEEAREEVLRLQGLLPRWEDNPQDHESLVGIRRSFHTLKGSGRLVGAQLIGEFAWSMESILNRIISQTLNRTPEITELFQLAVKALPELIEQLEVGRAPEQNIAGLIAMAHAIAQAGVGQSSDQKTSVTSSDEQPNVSPNRVMDQAPRVDPALHEIYAKEVAGHLNKIRTYLQSCNYALPPYPITEELYRACHTLRGASKAAGVQHGIKIAEPINHYISKLFDNSLPLPREGMRLLQDAVTAIEHLVAHVDSDTEAFTLGSDLAARVERLEQELDATLSHGTNAVIESTHLESTTLESAGEELELKVDQLKELVDQYAESKNTDQATVGIANVEEQPKTIVETTSWAANFEAPVISSFESMNDAVHVDTHDVQQETRQAEVAVDDQQSASVALYLDDSYDPDIAAIFAEEASELLEVADRVVRAWHDERNNSDHVTELKRVLHTLKGGARMAGIHAMGDLTHEMESLVGARARSEFNPQEKMFGLLQAGIDELLHMRDAITQGQKVLPATQLIKSIHALIDQYSEHSEFTGPSDDDAKAIELKAVQELSEINKEIQQLSERAEIGNQIQASAGVDQQLEHEPVDVVESESVQVAPYEAIAEQHIEAVALPGHGQVVAERAETARVDADLLESLLNAAGEVNILKSRMEQQASSLAFNLTELGRTVTRLKDQLRKLEIETETQILHRHRQDTDERQGFDPLELDRYSTIQQLSRALSESVSDVDSIAGLLENISGESQNLLVQQSRVVTELQNGLMKTRMVPFSYHAPRLTRLVRQVASELGKQVEITITGATGEVDRQVLDRMLPPFEHMIRNSIVHGIEMPQQRTSVGKSEVGAIRLALRREGSDMVITLEDDGRGIDINAIHEKARGKGLITGDRRLTDDEALQLITESGFSTSKEVTQYAGRGVGMDVVITAIKKLGGTLSTETKLGRGTKFTIRLPFTLAISQALLVRVAEYELYALPLSSVEGVVRLPKSEVLSYLSDQSRFFEYAGQRYKVQYLSDFIGAQTTVLPKGDDLPLVLIKAGERSTALVTDELVGNREIVAKAVGPQVSSIRGILGATILGDGRVVIILDMGVLVRSEWMMRKDKVTMPAEDRRAMALVVDDSITVRRVTQRLLERHGLRVLTAKDGLDAWELLQEHLPDLILMDIEMPRMDGYELTTRIRSDERLRNVPIVIITSRVGEKHRAHAFGIGINDYLGKPYQEHQLLNAIDPLLNAKRIH